MYFLHLGYGNKEFSKPNFELKMFKNKFENSFEILKRVSKFSKSR